MRAMRRSSVDFPDPLCPMSPNDSPCATSSETSCSARNSSYCVRLSRVIACLRSVGLSVYNRNVFETFSTEIAGAGALRSPVTRSQLLGDLAGSAREDPPPDRERADGRREHVGPVRERRDLELEEEVA